MNVAGSDTLLDLEDQLAVLVLADSDDLSVAHVLGGVKFNALVVAELSPSVVVESAVSDFSFLGVPVGDAIVV